MRLGRHLPTGSKPVQALEIGRYIGCEAIQIFVTNPRAWAVPAPDAAAAAAFSARAEALGWPVVVHAAYIINLASPRDEVFTRSVTLLRATLERAAHFGASSVVFHIGSHTGAGEEAGLARLVQGIALVLAETDVPVQLLLENDTGGGGKLGYRLENLAAVLDRLPQHAARLGVCIDTAHLWGAGFDVATPEGAQATLAALALVIGFDRVPVLHVNDARVGLGSHRDVHARLGEGQMQGEGLAIFLRHPGWARTTALLETPLPERTPDHPDWEAERTLMEQARIVAGLPPLERESLVGAADEADGGEAAPEDALAIAARLTSRDV